MTRWKNELRRKGFTLECDMPMVPFNGIQSIIPGLWEDGICITTVHASIVITDYIDRQGIIKTHFA